MTKQTNAPTTPVVQPLRQSRPLSRTPNPPNKNRENELEAKIAEMNKKLGDLARQNERLESNLEASKAIKKKYRGRLFNVTHKKNKTSQARANKRRREKEKKILKEAKEKLRQQQI